MAMELILEELISDFQDRKLPVFNTETQHAAMVVRENRYRYRYAQIGKNLGFYFRSCLTYCPGG